VRSLREERAAAQVTAKAEANRATVRTEGTKSRKPGLSQKEQRRLIEVEGTLSALHDRMAVLDSILADPSAFLRPESPGHQALKDRDSSQAELETMELEWLELEEKRTAD
jgi:ATP-binding cassette subfamily F protein uup